MSASVESVEIAQVAARAVITDCFVIASAPNERQVNAIVDNIEERLREAGHKPVRREGTREGRWALLDYVDVVVHVQHNDERNFYALERLWKDCPVVAVDGLGEQNVPVASNGESVNGESERGEAGDDAE
jgi:ribosome-associated protein